MDGPPRAKGMLFLGLPDETYAFARVWSGCLLAIWLATGAAGADELQEAVSGVPLPMFEDAQLNDLCFIDAQTGWAVGDRGVIWHTANAGASWQRQESGVDCRLESVCFVDAQHGWIVGGRARPGTNASEGVLLRTRDAGRTWQPDRRLMLPGLAKVGFFDQSRGWVVGDSSALFGSGAFTTQDGGRTWVPLSTTALRGWTTADFIGGTNGALAGRRGATAVTRLQSVEAARSAPFGQRTFRNLKLSSPTRGWLVGDGGLVLMTDDLGRSWQTTLGDLPQGASLFEFHAVDATGDHCWVAGAPGTRVMRTADGGRTWQSLATGQAAPLRAVCFVDERCGWAAGAWGTILATRDGGETWQQQRAGGTRAAVLGVYGEAGQVPWEALARLAGNDGYLTAIELLNQRVSMGDDLTGADEEDRAREAVALTGGGSVRQAWQFPLPATGQSMTAEQLVTAWNRAADGNGLERMLEHVVRQIRTWRPEIVLTHAASIRGDDPRGHLINQVVLRAVEAAADATAFSEHLVHLGLEPWQVKKVFGEMPGGVGGPVVVHASQFAPRLGRSLADLTAIPRALISHELQPAQAERSFRAYLNRLPQERGAGDFTSGISLYPGGEARRMLVEPDGESMNSLRRMAQRQRNLEVILERWSNESGGGEHLLGEIDSLTADWGDDQAGQVMYQLASQYHRAGRWDMAAETLQRFVDRFPQHRLAPAALTWLVQAWSSGEVAWRLQQNQRISVQMAKGAPSDAGAPQSVVATSAAEAPYAVGQATRLGIDLSQQTDRMARAVAVGSELEQLAPAVHAEPAVGFPLSVAQRDEGQVRLAERFHDHIRRSRSHDAWWACAESEAWLVAREGVPPKPVWHVARATSRPRLDGKFDDAVWQQARPIELKSSLHDDHAWQAAAMLAYDDEHLYLATSCRKATGAEYVSTAGPRQRDAEMRGQDRIELLLDVDQDWTTYYRLVIDQRGWGGEDCWGDATWNPDWFIACEQTDEAWKVEAALPWSSVAAQPPTSGTAWSAGMQRTVPDVGFQSWSTPAAVSIRPEGFGLLLFD